MGTIKRTIIVDDEDILNLHHCIERTQHMWDSGKDLWPFTILDIIKRYDKYEKKLNNDSWATSPDRMGGQYTEDEIKRAGEWR
jgi:hypothetical protein